MVLFTGEFRLHRSLRKTLARFIADPRCEIRFDSAFDEVIRACAGSRATGPVRHLDRARDGRPPTGPSIAPASRTASKTWIDGRLAGGLYCVAIGRAVFGESMFTRVPDASKIALAALVAFCRHARHSA